MKKGILFILIIFLLFISGCSKDIGIKDDVSPIIIYQGNDITYTYGSPTPDWIKDIYAIDDTDGNITNSIKVDTSKINLNKLGTYPIYYSVNDKAGNTSKLTRNIIVKDVTSPHLSEFSDITIPVNSSEPNYLDKIKSSDNFDGDLTNSVTVDDSEVIYDKIGAYPLYYQVEDSNGNKTTVTVTVHIVESDQIKPDLPLGLPINMVTSYNKHYNYGKPIFDEDWFNTLNFVSVKYLSSDTEMNSKFFSEDKIVSTMDDVFIIEDTENNQFLNNAFDTFEQQFTLGNYKSQYFYYRQFEYYRFGIAISGYKSNINGFIENLNQEYLSDLEKINNNQMTYQEFFSKYGTHYVAKTVFGGEAQIFYSVLKENEVPREEIENNQYSEISVGIATPYGTSTSISESDDISYFTISINGGTSINLQSDKDFDEVYSDWVSSLSNNDNCQLVDFGNDGLIPLWDILPNQYQQLKVPMEEAYQQYKENYS